MKNKEFFKEIFSIKSILVTILFGFVNAVSCWLFVVPNDYACSGVEGVGVIVQELTGFNLSVFQLIVNVPLCIFAFIFVNRKFAFNTVLYTITYSVAYFLCEKFNLEPFKYFSYGHDTIYPVILEGVFMGFSYGFLYKEFSSTGGVDIISRYINKVKPHFNFFYVTFFINAIIAIVSCFVFKQEINGEFYYSYKPACMCLLCDFISNFVGDNVIKGIESATEYFIISDYIDDISKDILEATNHSSTQIDCFGSVSNRQKRALVCIVNNFEKDIIEKILANYPDCFVSVRNINKVIGKFYKKRYKL